MARTQKECRVMSEQVPAVCEFCVNRNHRADIRCTEECYSLEAYNKVIAEAIAARDKWLIKTIEDRYGDGHGRPLIQIGVQDWQDFKLSLQSSAALTNLMGKFPDLPEVD
jgi:hypothetical protein